MEFVKAHGTGNDFVLLPDLDDEMELTAELTVALCTPHTGLGADGVIRLGAPRSDGDDVFMDYRNADGSIAQMCGNGVRCVAKYVADRGVVPGDTIRVGTRGGCRNVLITDRDSDGRVRAVSVDMGVPDVGKVAWPVQLDGGAAGTDPTTAETLMVTTVSMGNPHAVAVTDDVTTWPLEWVAGQLARHPEFPDGVNTEVIQVVDRSHIRGRIFERGVGETLASGTGASAMAVAAIVAGLTDSRLQVGLPGGPLEVDWSHDQLIVTGPAVEIAYGRLDDAWLLPTT